MKWMASLVLIAAIGGGHLQCLTPNDNFEADSFNADLSGVTDFSVDLFKELSPGQSLGNFFFSPYSVWTALTLAYFGSAGNTQRQLEAVLRASDKGSTIKLWRGLERLYESRQQGNAQYTFSLASRAYFRDTVQLRPCIENLLKNELRTISSSDNAGATASINNFVSETTRGLITDIVTERDISRSLMVLVNAAYFKGTWKYQFEPTFTRQRTFFIGPQQTASVEMMSRLGDFRYGDSNDLGARVLELPYSGDAISMYLLLPSPNGPEETRFARMVSNLNGAAFRQAIDPVNMRIIEVDVHVPKFKFEFRIEDELKQALRNLGITDLFNGAQANLTDFSTSLGSGVSQVIHKAFVEVNEEGTEAAAATVLISTLSLFPVNNTVLFHCNQPFVFIIHDNETNNILFMGAIKDPRDL